MDIHLGHSSQNNEAALIHGAHSTLSDQPKQHYHIFVVHQITFTYYEVIRSNLMLVLEVKKQVIITTSDNNNN